MTPNLSGEEKSYYTSIRKILLWLESGEGIYDRQKFEAYYGGDWNGGYNDSMDVVDDQDFQNGGNSGNINSSDESNSEAEKAEEVDEIVEDIYQDPGHGEQSVASST